MILTDSKACKGCNHFLRHYVLSGSRLFQTNCGHCTFQRAKHKRPDARTCENFTPTDPEVETFVTKEYLSKALLNKVLAMELVPEIVHRESE